MLSSHVDSVWNLVLPLVESALDYDDSRYSASSIYEEIKNRGMQLWLVMNGDIEACLVTEIRKYPLKTVCTIFLAAGKNLENWIHVQENLKAWAKTQGCSTIELYGRPGWEKKLGWKKTQVILREDI